MAETKTNKRTRRTKAEIEQDKQRDVIRKKFTDWLYQQYNISFLPKYFFVNLDKVYKGTYKNLTKPCPVEDLWDMWQRKMPYLLKIYDRNTRQGKDMEGIGRINYDMAIVLSKYDSYLVWKEQQERMLALRESAPTETINYTSITQKAVAPVKTENIDINSILDDI